MESIEKVDNHDKIYELVGQIEKMFRSLKVKSVMEYLSVSLTESLRGNSGAMIFRSTSYKTGILVIVYHIKLL